MYIIYDLDNEQAFGPFDTQEEAQAFIDAYHAATNVGNAWGLVVPLLEPNLEEIV